jgi:hypothetical protein
MQFTFDLWAPNTEAALLFAVHCVSSKLLLKTPKIIAFLASFIAC